MAYKYTKDLLDCGADPNIKTTSDYTALHISVEKNILESVKILLEFKADPEIKNFLDETPLYLAAKNNYVDVAHLLIKKGADMKSEEPLLVACKYGNYDMVRLFGYYDVIFSYNPSKKINSRNKFKCIEAFKEGKLIREWTNKIPDELTDIIFGYHNPFKNKID